MECQVSVDPHVVLKDIARSGIPVADTVPFLEKLTKLVPSVIYIFNHKTQSNEYANRSIGDMIGYEPEEVQAMGAELMPTLCHPADLGRIIENFEAMRHFEDGEVGQIEYRMRHKLGHWIWFMSSDSVFERGPDSSVLRHVGVATNVTDIKAAEARALADKRAADLANEELRSFAYTVSHDIKAPSKTLRFLFEEMRYAEGFKSDKEIRDLVSMCDSTVHRMQELVTDILDYTLMFEEDAELQNVDLNAVLRDVVNDLQGDVSEADGAVEIGELQQVRGNESQLRTLFQNLIQNALRYRRPDVPPRISVQDVTARFEDQVRVTVSDNGIGLAPENFERIFGVFKRLDTSGGPAGSGLGLAICRKIMLKHGGDISVASKEGEGSTFTITLSGAHTG